jgi:uncharacterized protein
MTSSRARQVLSPSGRAWCAVLAVLALFSAASAAEARSFIWKVSRGPQTVYVIGSVHMLSKDYYPLSPALDTAFKASDLLVEEVDLAELLSPEAQLSVLTRGMLPGDQSLEKVVSPATFAQLSKRFSDMGLPVEPLKRFKPWSLALTLLGLEWQRAGFDPELGLDKHFYDRAQAEQKPVQGLETAEYQISRFDTMTWPQQDKLLAETLKDIDTEKANVKTLADAWRAGDASTVEQLVLRDLKSDPEMYQRLLLDRNRAWLPKIEALFSRRSPAFIVVGAAHVIGPDGILAMLRVKGYTVEQM